MRSVDVLKLSYSYVRLTIFFNCVYSVIKERTCMWETKTWENLYGMTSLISMHVRIPADICYCLSLVVGLNVIYLMFYVWKDIIVLRTLTRTLRMHVTQKFHLFLKIYFTRGYLTRYFISTFYTIIIHVVSVEWWYAGFGE